MQKISKDDIKKYFSIKDGKPEMFFDELLEKYNISEEELETILDECAGIKMKR